jgi:arylsulfatase A-like enzyme
MAAPNILFIMCDQLRWDYLSCYGHPHLQTPNIDALAARGVRFDRAYVQSPVCGPSRMSTYTGRYMRSHGANWNRFPLRIGEPTLGDHLRKLGMRAVLVGKTHMQPDTEGMERLGIDPNSTIGLLTSETGFEPFERDDGLHPDPAKPRPRYDTWLNQRGYPGANPWEHWANSGEAEDGSLQNGWLLVHADKQARVAEEDSETPYMTRRAMEFIAGAGDQPWCVHLSYIKPHWPYIAPAPYHTMYGTGDVIPAHRSEAERRDPHPVRQAFMQMRVGRNFSRDEVRERVIPAYMGLIKQIDDQIGVLLRFLNDLHLTDNTLIVFTSDHGDYLGDHWMGEKDFFHECTVRVPLIIADPRRSADATRGTSCDKLVEAIDLVPSFIEAAGGTPPRHIVEGRSLLPLLRGEEIPWRQFAISEYDYSMLEARLALAQPIPDCRLFMIRDERFKLIHATGYRPILYDLATDPDEFHDLGADPAHQETRARLSQALMDWALTDHNRITMPDSKIAAYANGAQLRAGIVIGIWDEAELAEARREAGLD